MVGSGHCLCGAVTFRFEGEILWCAHCHCESCRRATASPFTTFIGVRKAGFAFSGAMLRNFQSSPGVTRWFCGKCGSPMGYENVQRPDQVDLYAATLDDPSSVEPQCHEHVDEKLPWIVLADHLPGDNRKDRN
jgi:hypothetical protein